MRKIKNKRHFREAKNITEVRLSKQIIYNGELFDTPEFLKMYKGEKMNRFIYDLMKQKTLKILI